MSRHKNTRDFSHRMNCTQTLVTVSENTEQQIKQYIKNQKRR